VQRAALVSPRLDLTPTLRRRLVFALRASHPTPRIDRNAVDRVRDRSTNTLISNYHFFLSLFSFQQNLATLRFSDWPPPDGRDIRFFTSPQELRGSEPGLARCDWSSACALNNLSSIQQAKSLVSDRAERRQGRDSYTSRTNQNLGFRARFNQMDL